MFLSGRLLSEVNIWTPDLTRDLNLGICWMTESDMAVLPPSNTTVEFPLLCGLHLLSAGVSSTAHIASNCRSILNNGNNMEGKYRGLI